MPRTRKPRPPRCHVCHRRALRYLEQRDRWMCDSCGKVFDEVVVQRHNPDMAGQQMRMTG